MIFHLLEPWFLCGHLPVRGHYHAGTYCPDKGLCVLSDLCGINFFAAVLSIHYTLSTSFELFLYAIKRGSRPSMGRIIPQGEWESRGKMEEKSPVPSLQSTARKYTLIRGHLPVEIDYHIGNSCNAKSGRAGIAHHFLL